MGNQTETILFLSFCPLQPARFSLVLIVLDKKLASCKPDDACDDLHKGKRFPTFWLEVETLPPNHGYLCGTHARTWDLLLPFWWCRKKRKKNLGANKGARRP